MSIEESILIDDTALISKTSVINGSIRNSKIQIGARTKIYDFVCLSCIGGDGDIIIGEDCHVNPHTTLYSGNGIRLGNFVLIGPGCSLVPTNHAFMNRKEKIRKQGFMSSKGGIVIEDDVWIGANSVLLDGTHIETGSIIAANSIVNCHIPSFEIWGSSRGKIRKIRAR